MRRGKYNPVEGRSGSSDLLSPLGANPSSNFSCIIKDLTERRWLLFSGIEGDGGEYVGN